MEEQPVALATTMRSPNSWVTSLTYGVSPQPAQAPENSNRGFLNWLSLTAFRFRAPLYSGSVWANSQLASWASWVCRGFISRATFLPPLFTGQTCVQFSQPVQSSTETCMRYFRPLKAGPLASVVSKEAGALAASSSVSR